MMNFEKNKINRSHSESDLYVSQFDNLSVSSPRDFTKFSTNSYSPIVRRVYVEEIISSDDNPTKFRRTRFSEIIDNITYNMPNLKGEKKIWAPSNSECEEVPMEIDNSYDERFPKMMGTERCMLPKQIVLDEPDTNDNDDNDSVPKKRITRIVHINANKKKENKNKWFLIAPLLSILLYLYFFKNMDIIVNNDVQIENIRSDLMRNVYGHKPIVDLIIQILEERKNWVDKLKVLSFVGSQGVGKTFVANVIKKHFPPNLVHEIYGTRLYYHNEKQKIIDSINSCCLNLIIIDDLKLDDNVDLFAFLHSLPKDDFILLLTIFNVHYKDDNMNTVVNHEDIIKIRDSFDNAGIRNYELLVFEDFTHKQIRGWLKGQLKNVSLPAQDMIIDNILDTHDIKHGLKGLHSKLFLELKKYRK